MASALAALTLAGPAIGHAAAQSTASATAHAQPKSTASTRKATAGKGTKVAKGKATASRTRGQTAPTRDRIVEIQEALAREGFYSGTPSGKWDEAHQRSHEQVSDGEGTDSHRQAWRAEFAEAGPRFRDCREGSAKSAGRHAAVCAQRIGPKRFGARNQRAVGLFTSSRPSARRAGLPTS